MAERKTYTAEDFKGRNGRRVAVEGVINDAGPNSVVVTFDPLFASAAPVARVPFSAIIEILPDRIKVGDTVKWAGSVKCIVRAIDDGYAWVRDPADSYIVPLDHLTLVERG